MHTFINSGLYNRIPSRLVGVGFIPLTAAGVQRSTSDPAVADSCEDGSSIKLEALHPIAWCSIGLHGEPYFAHGCLSRKWNSFAPLILP